MEQKDTYTLKELYGELDIPLAELGRRAGISEVTVAKIRDGKSARRSTVNSLLRTFSEIYGIKLSIDNVKDVLIGDKLARREQSSEQATVPSVPASMPYETSAISSPQKRLTTAKKSIPSETSQKKRTYKPRDTALPPGCILASNFAEQHGVPRPTFIDHMNTGLGPGLIHGPDVHEDGSVQVKDWVRHEERNKRVRKDGTIEKEKYLTPAQQTAALDFWKRHGVAFTVPESEQEAPADESWWTEPGAE